VVYLLLLVLITSPPLSSPLILQVKPALGANDHLSAVLVLTAHNVNILRENKLTVLTRLFVLGLLLRMILTGGAIEQVSLLVKGPTILTQHPLAWAVAVVTRLKVNQATSRGTVGTLSRPALLLTAGVTRVGHSE
jgi:hypothetical protein